LLDSLRGWHAGHKNNKTIATLGNLDHEIENNLGLGRVNDFSDGLRRWGWRYGYCRDWPHRLNSIFPYAKQLQESGCKRLCQELCDFGHLLRVWKQIIIASHNASDL
jgi:hypothetical protein